MRDYQPLAREASMQELVTAWDIPYHVLSRILRTKQIAHTRQERNKRFYSPAVQAVIAEALRLYATAPRLLDKEQTLAELQKQARWMAEIDTCRQQAEEGRAMLHGMQQQIDALQAWRRDSLHPALAQLDTQLLWVTEAINTMMERLEDVAGKLGGLAVTQERRLQALEHALLPHTDDPLVEESRARGQRFLETTETEVLLRQATKGA